MVPLPSEYKGHFVLNFQEKGAARPAAVADGESPWSLTRCVFFTDGSIREKQGLQATGIAWREADEGKVWRVGVNVTKIRPEEPAETNCIELKAIGQALSYAISRYADPATNKVEVDADAEPGCWVYVWTDSDGAMTMLMQGLEGWLKNGVVDITKENKMEEIFAFVKAQILCLTRGGVNVELRLLKGHTRIRGNVIADAGAGLGSTYGWEAYQKSHEDLGDVAVEMWPADWGSVERGGEEKEVEETEVEETEVEEKEVEEKEGEEEGDEEEWGEEEWGEEWGEEWREEWSEEQWNEEWGEEEGDKEGSEEGEIREEKGGEEEGSKEKAGQETGAEVSEK